MGRKGRGRREETRPSCDEADPLYKPFSSSCRRKQTVRVSSSSPNATGWPLPPGVPWALLLARLEMGLKTHSEGLLDTARFCL